MNLDLGILWIEDSFSSQEEESLRRRVMEAGFIARIEVIPNGDGIGVLAKRHSLYHCFDIILLDYRLKGANGDDLAPAVRELFPSTTILFYSGSVEEHELRTLIAAREVEGVYCSHRRRFIDRTGTLINQAARSLDRLSGMRGLAMRVVAECDALMKASLLSMSLRDPNCAAKIVDLDKDVVDHLDKVAKAYEIATAGDLNQRFETFAVDSAKIFKHFRRLTKVVAADPSAFSLSDDQVERIRELRSMSSNYDKNVLRKRNILGHAVEIANEDGWELQGASEIAISDFPEIRQAFATHIDVFREMATLVTMLDGK